MKSALKGKLIVLTRSVKKNDPWVTYLKKQGAIPYSFPTIEIIPKILKPTQEKILKSISDFDWVVFTSATGLLVLKQLAKKSAIDISFRRMPKIAVIGDATAKTAQAMGYRIAFQPSMPASAALAFELEPVHGRSILLLRTAIASQDMNEVLIARGAEVTDLSLYKTILRRDPDPKFIKLLDTGKVDMLAFASPSAVHGFFERLRLQKKSIKQAREVTAVAIGPSVGAALRKAGFKDVREAIKPGIKEMIKVIHRPI